MVRFVQRRGPFCPETWSDLSGPFCPWSVLSEYQVMGPGFDTRSSNILSFLLPLFQEGQLSVTGESMCTKYWLTA